MLAHGMELMEGVEPVKCGLVTKEVTMNSRHHPLLAHCLNELGRAVCWESGHALGEMNGRKC